MWYQISDMALEDNNTIFQAGIKKHPEWELEKTIDSNEFSEWLSNNFNVALGFSILYMAAVFGGKRYMENKPRFNLRHPMMIWSLMLAVFSVCGAVRSTIVIYYLYQEDGIRSIICSEQFYLGPIARFWGPVFVTSKILEYMDTVFIILRKQRLIFLHWYHHLTVSLFSWWTYGAQFAGGGVFMTVNFIVHAMMYTYYALRAANVKIPRKIALLITSSQIIQMFVGCWTVYLVNEWRDISSCRSSWEYIFYGSIMYLSYLLLFVHFFYTTYISKKPASSFAQRERSVPTEKSEGYEKSERRQTWTDEDAKKGKISSSPMPYVLRERKSRK